MYAPKHFREEREEVLVDMIKKLKFGLLVAAPEVGEFEAVSLPVLLKSQNDKLYLETHVGVANPIWKSAKNIPSLIVFQGPQAYIRPGWYPLKRENGKAVPTWNYVSIQARGNLTAVLDRHWLKSHVDDLSQFLETDKDEPWSIDDAPTEYIETMLNGIVGLRVEVTSLQGIWKMNQNHTKTNRLGAAKGLANTALESDLAVSDIMREIESQRQ